MHNSTFSRGIRSPNDTFFELDQIVNTEHETVRSFFIESMQRNGHWRFFFLGVLRGEHVNRGTTES